MVRLVGHRGGRNLWPENSLGGFRNVLSLPIDAVEFDVHLTQAGELLVIHDPMLDRTTERTGVVAELPAGAHKQVLLKDGEGDHVPSFREVLDVLGASELELHIEIKSDRSHVPYSGIVPAVFTELARYDLGSRAVLTSFDPAVLEELRATDPGGRRLASIDRNSADRFGGFEATLRTLEALVEIVAVEKSLLRAQWDLVTSIVPPDRLCAWVVNEIDDLEYWLSRPVGNITSDRPDLAVAVKGKRRA